MTRRLVMIESPYRAPTTSEIATNVAYARRCMKHSIDNGEAPFASHLLYTQPGVLDDGNSYERNLGINMGRCWSVAAELHAFYVDRGWSIGMLSALELCQKADLAYCVRALDTNTVTRTPNIGEIMHRRIQEAIDSHIAEWGGPTSVLPTADAYEHRRRYVRGTCPEGRDYNEWCRIVDEILPPLKEKVVEDVQK